MSEAQNWDKIENRLDRIEAILEANSRQIEANSRQIEANSQQIEKNTTALMDMRLAISSLIETSNQFQRNFEIIVLEIQDIKKDIRGLQVENRRILDHLFGQQGN